MQKRSSFFPLPFNIVLLWVDLHVEVVEGGDAGGGEIGAGGGECDSVDVEGVTNGTAVILAPASTSLTD